MILLIAVLVSLYIFFQKSRKEFIFTLSNGDYFGVLSIKGYIHPFIIKVEDEKLEVKNSEGEKKSPNLILKAVGYRIIAVSRDGTRFILGRGRVSSKKETPYISGRIYSLVNKENVGDWAVWKLNYLSKEEDKNSPYVKLIKYYLSLKREVENLEVSKDIQAKELSSPLVVSDSVLVEELSKVREETKKLKAAVKELRERIALSMSVTKAGQIVSLSRRIKEYNDRWLSSMIKSLPEQTIAVNSAEYEHALKLFKLLKEVKEEEKKVKVLREFYDKKL